MKALLVIIFSVVLLLACKQKEPVGNGILLTDAADILNDAEEDSLQNKLNAIDGNGKYRLYVYTVTGGDTMENFKHRETFLSHIDKEKQPNTVLMYVATKARKIHIRTGRYIMYHLTDSMCLNTINYITPYFKKGEYYTGIDHGVDMIDSLVIASGF